MEMEPAQEDKWADAIVKTRKKLNLPEWEEEGDED
jgi:hypothetical protein